MERHCRIWPEDFDVKTAAKSLAEEMYQKGLKKLTDDFTADNYWSQIKKIERYKKIHGH